MKMKTTTICLSLFLIFVFCRCAENDGFFLKDIDFSDGNYALYVEKENREDRRNFECFMVLDEAALIKNQDKLRVVYSFANYLPGGGKSYYGVRLYKNKKQVKSKIGAAFSHFEIGDLKKYGIPAEEHNMSGVKKEIKDRIDSLEADENVYFVWKPEFLEGDKEFIFSIDFPSIALDVTRDTLDWGREVIKTINGFEERDWYHNGNYQAFKEKWNTKIEECIRSKTGEITDYDIDITLNSSFDVALFEVNKNDEGWCDERLRNTNNKTIHLKDFEFFYPEARITASKKVAEKLLALDYDNCIDESERNKAKVIARMKELVKQSTSPNLSVENGEVRICRYLDSTTKSEALFELQHSLYWITIEN